MAIKLVKSLACEEDLELGLGTVVQQRDIAGNGPENVTLTQINASSIPTTVGNIQTDIDSMYTSAEIDAAFALISTVLTKTQLDPYTPTNQYHPATKKYVDDTLIATGSGDMTKAVYDTTANGIVDNAEAVGGKAETSIVLDRGLTSDCDSATTAGIYYGTSITNAPTANKTMVLVYVTNSLLVQRATDLTTGFVYTRYYDTTWSSWVVALDSSKVVNSLLGSLDTTTVLGAQQGKILDEAKIEADDYATSTVGGTIKARLDGTTLYLTTDGTNA